MPHPVSRCPHCKEPIDLDDLEAERYGAEADWNNEADARKRVLAANDAQRVADAKAKSDDEYLAGFAAFMTGA